MRGFLGKAFLAFIGIIECEALYADITYCISRPYVAIVHSEQKLPEEEAFTEDGKSTRTESTQLHCFSLPTSRPTLPSVSGQTQVSDQYHTGRTPREETPCPVNIATGAKTFKRLEYRGGGEFPLEISRRRIPRTDGVGTEIFGASWHSDFTHNIILFPRDDGTTVSVILHRFGTLLPFVFKNNEWTTSTSATFELQLLDDGQWQVTDPKTGMVELYDAKGYMVKRTNLQGVNWTLRYIRDGEKQRLDTIVHSSGRKMTFNFNEVNWNEIYLTITDPNGFVYSLTDGRSLDHWQQYGSQVLTYPEGTGTYTLGGGSGYQYHEYIDGEVYKKHLYEVFDGVMRVKSSGLADGYLTSTFDYKDNQTIVTNAKGAVTTYTYAADSTNLIKLDRSGTSVCPSAAAATEYYANNERVKWKDDWQGNRTHYTYDDDDNILTEYLGGVTRQNVWAAYGLIKEVRIWDGALPQVECAANDPCYSAPTTPEAKTVFEYYPANHAAKYRIKSITEYDNHNNASTTHVTYVMGSNQLPLKKVVDGPRTDVSDITVYTYNNRGDLTRVDDPHGNYIKHEYQGTDDRIWRTTDANGYSKTYTYDARNRVTRVATNDVPARVTYYDYNGLNQITGITTPVGSIKYEYTATGRLEKTTYNAGDQHEQNFVEYSYDLLGNVTQAHKHDVRVISQRVQVGRNSWVDKPFPSFKHRYTNSRYDATGNLESIDDTKGNALFSYKYNKNAQLEVKTDALNRSTTFSYAPSGQLQGVTAPDKGKVLYDYYANKEVKNITDPLGNTTEYRLEGRNYFTEGPDVDSEWRITDAVGNTTALKTKPHSLWQSIDSQYDAQNRVTRVVAGREVQVYEYDSYKTPVSGQTCGFGAGRLCQVKDSSGATRFQYAKNGSLLRKTAVVGGTTFNTSYEYDDKGRLSIKVLPNGVKTRYSYDGLSQVAKIEAYVANKWQTVVDAAQRVGEVKLVYGNTIEQALHYNDQNQIVQVGSKTYRRNAAGEIINISSGEAYRYDANSRVTGETYSGGSQGYTYDKNGNRLSHARGSSRDTYIYQSNSNRLDKITGSQAKDFSYDKNGNVIKKTGYGGTFNYGYDTLERMTSANSTTFKYNAFNQRVNKGGVNGYRYLYGNDGLLEAETVARSSTLAKVYIYWRGRPVGLVKNNVLYFIQSDHLNRPFAVTDINKRTVWAAKNTAFDRTVTTNSIDDLNIGFPGQYYDRETKLWYNWHRYYDASTGRYLQSDPIGLSGGLNTYAYVNGNPVSLVDPWGLCAQEGNSTVGSDPQSEGDYLQCVANCVEENRFDLEKTLATAVAAGAGAPIPKTEQELRRGSATTNPNIDKNTTRLSRAGLNLRQSAKGTQYFRQTRLPSQALRWTGRAAGAVAIPALIAEGFYDWGVIGYCAATCR